MADALHEGASALQALIRRLSDKGGADLEAAYAVMTEAEAGDARDYVALTAMLSADLAANLGHPVAEHRQGYLRALCDLLTMVGDGTGPRPDWDPIATTAGAFARPARTERGASA